jgi:release factor glutamine methyltransferase
VLGKNRAEVKLISAVSDKQYADIMRAAERRAKGESIDNIFGFTEFYGLTFDVNKKVLTPRMETELLVEQVLKAQKQYKKCTILDVGTGSGAIAVSVAKNCDAQVTSVDVSTQALAVAESNAKKNGVKVEFVHSNLFDNLKRKRKFDIIVSNPPYIPSAEIEKLDKNVKECDPVLALDGGEDGLDFYRSIISKARDRLNAKGQIFFEVGKGQAASVRRLLRENGFEQIRTTKDYNKIERIVSGTIL